VVKIKHNSILSNYRKTDEEIIRQKNIELSRKNFRHYCNLINPEFYKQNRKYQDILCNTMQNFYEKKLINIETNKAYSILIINLPPGFGKSYTTALFNTWCYGKNIKHKVISVSYNQSLSIQSSKAVRELIQVESLKGDEELYVFSDIFPKCEIKYGDGAMERWSLKGKNIYNSYLATSLDGTLTGMRCNMGIIDDPIKNANEAYNENIKSNHFNFYKNTFSSRILDGGQQIIIQTRWATDDLAGKLLSEFKEKCYELKMCAVVDNKSLCEDLYSSRDLQDKQKTLDKNIWLANYMQQPIDLKGVLYNKFKTYGDVHTDMFERIIAYVDTADTGNDYLCMWIVGVVGTYGYVLDTLYTDKSMEFTESETARLLHMHSVRECIVESNNGGRGFARNVESILKNKLKNKICIVTWFHQNKNKNSRILVNATNVNEQIVLPESFEKRFPKLYKDLTSYQRKGKNKHDDAPDSLTGVVELINGEIKTKNKIKVGIRSRLGL
jgi:predicted phage terminase large subunit-like protein